MTRGLLAVALMCMAAAPRSQTSPASANVTVELAVEDESGRGLEGLQASAFTVRVDGDARPITSLAPAGPLSLVVLSDRTRSMRSFTDRLDKVLRETVDALGDQDRVRAGAIDEAIVFEPAFDDRRGFRPAPRKPTPVRPREGMLGSPLWDAVYESAELLAAEPRRRVLLVASDGRATGNLRGLDETAEFALASRVAVSTIAPEVTLDIPQNEFMRLIVRPVVNLQKIATYTGGVFFADEGPDGDSKRLGTSIAQRLRTGYRLSFVVPSDGRLRRLEIQCSAATGRVRAPLAIRAPAAKSR